MSRSLREFKRALLVTPGGVNSPVRAFKAVGGSPRVIARAQGAMLTDVDGREYVDYVGGWGAAIVGHAHPAVVEAVARAARDGLSFGLASMPETDLAEEIIRRMPSIEQVRLVNSGTEAVMSAIRLARAATGRSKVIKFAGCYHGHSDGLLARAGSGVATLGLPDSQGVTAASAGETIVAQFNDLQAVDKIARVVGDQIAAVIVEPIAGNMGVSPPVQGFLRGLREICDRIGAILIFDEVMTGFRVARGGAQSLFGVAPDLTTLGKVIGGGLPVGAYGGTRSLMQRVAPSGPVYQAGTFSGNPVTVAAGLATLKLLDDQAYATLERSAALLEQGLKESLSAHGRRACVQRVGSMLTVFFGVDSVNNADQAGHAAHDTFAWFFRDMLETGIHLPPSGYEPWFVSLSHNDQIIDKTISAADGVLAEIDAATTPMGI